MSDFERVERPQRRAHHGIRNARYEMYEAIARTATEGGAVRVPLNGLTTEGLRRLVHSAMRTRRLRAFTRTDSGDAIVCWAENL